MANKKDSKSMIYVIIVVALVILVYAKVQQPTSPHNQILPEAGYCLDINKDVSYSTVILNNTIYPREYCKLEDFCDEFEVSIVSSSTRFDQELLDRTQELWEGANYTCFQEIAPHTQRDAEIDIFEGDTVQSKFVCCNSNGHELTTGYCEENTCGGRFTGITDSHDCKIYALEQCKAETDCESIGGEIVCDPQPYDDGSCVWETESNYGQTYFTSFTNCGLEIEENCDTEKEYCCDKTCSIPCNMPYELGTGTFIKGCGGYVEGGN